MDADDAGIGEKGTRCPDVRDVICCSGAGGTFLWVIDVGYVTVHWEDIGRIPLQGGPHTDGAEITEGTGWDVGVPPSGRGDCGGGPTRDGYLCCLTTEHSRTVHHDQAHYGPVYGGVEMPGYKGI